MKNILLFALLGLSLGRLASAQTVADPAAYYASTFGHDPGDKLLTVKMNFSRNGKNVVFVAFTSSGDKSGYLWLGFTPVEGGYARLPVQEVDGRNEQGAVRFRSDTLYNGYISELKAYGVLSYAPDGEVGSLVATVIQDGVLRQTVLKTIAPEGADAARYKTLFLSHHNPQVEETPIK